MELSKNNAKYIRSLHLKKYRDKFNKFLAEGNKICLEMLRNHKVQIEYLVANQDWLTKNQNLLDQASFQTYVLPAKLQASISNLSNVPEVMIVADKLAYSAPTQLSPRDWYLYLDGIQDPGNLGTILRIADWFGWNTLFCSKDTADLYNSKVIQASMGAFLRVQLHKIELDQVLEENPSTPIYGTSMDGQNVFQAPNIQAGVLVIGNEGQGIRGPILPHIETFLSIPQGKQGGAESLNAGVATGILCAILSNS